MALRDFSVYNHPLTQTNTLVEPVNPVETEICVLTDEYFSAEKHQDLIDIKPVSEIYQDLLQANTNSTTSLTSELAVAMESARQQLLRLMMNHPSLAKLFNPQQISHYLEGVDYSVIHCKTSNGQVVQNFNIVQLEKLVVNNENIDGECSSNMHQISAEHLHFFPALLIRLTQQSLETDDLETADRRQLLQYSRNLQNIRQKIIVNNTGLVAFLAYKYKTSSLSLDDLLQEGMVGLIRAVDRFDPHRGLCFSTYAVFWIKQAISRLIVKQEKVVRLPVALAEKASSVFDIMRRCYLEHERWPTDAELLEQCSLSADEIKTVSSYYQATHSLDASLNEEADDYTLLDNLKQQQFALPLNELIDTNLSLYLSNLVESLPEQEATILKLRFGLKNNTEMTLQAIADKLQVTRERVRQIQNQALKKLKQQFGCELMPFLETNDNY